MAYRPDLFLELTNSIFYRDAEQERRLEEVRALQGVDGVVKA